jgi:AAHS family benzoate transporter-like MFS transporter
MNNSNRIVPATSNTATRWAVVFACALVVICEGVDVVVYGVTIPFLMADSSLGVDKAVAGQIGSATFLGMLIGGVSAGKICQRLNLRIVILTGFVAFTALTALIMVSQNVWHLAVLRFAAGIGLGVVLPSALSLVRRYTSENRSALVFCIVLSGMPVGGIIATVVAQVVAPFGSWHLLFGISACVGVILLVPVWFLVPREREESGSSTTEATAPWSSLFTRATMPLLIAGIVATLFDLLAFYGVNTWLTQLMREFGMPLDNSLQITLVLNIGSVIGVIVAGAIAVRLGTRRMAAIAGLVSLVGLVAVAGTDARIGDNRSVTLRLQVTQSLLRTPPASNDPTGLAADVGDTSARSRSRSRSSADPWWPTGDGRGHSSATERRTTP